jgi:hypothetical protein
MPEPSTSSKRRTHVANGPQDNEYMSWSLDKLWTGVEAGR